MFVKRKLDLKIFIKTNFLREEEYILFVQDSFPIVQDFYFKLLYAKLHPTKHL